MENSATAQLSARLLAILAISIGSCKSPASVSSVDSTASPRAPHRATDGTIADAHANGGPVDLCEDRFEMCRHFKDRQGDKTLILEQTQVENKIYNHIENEHQTYKSLQLTFRVMLGSTEQVRVFDRVRSCGENARASYLDQSLSITDLDEDGIKEVSFWSCYG